MRFFLFLALLLQSPDATVPVDGKAFLTVEGNGVQIYRCTQQTSGFEWIFQSPEAVLTDRSTHKQVGTHGAGPSWVFKDGSSVKGKVLQKIPGPDPTSIPWLLLEAQPDLTHPGIFAKATKIRRCSTHGGNAPSTGCDANHEGTMLRVPYTATYSFYAAN